MNYKPLIYEKLKDFDKEVPGYSFIDTIFSVLVTIFKGEEINRSKLKELTDGQFYSAIQKTINKEKDE